ncbi:FAD:protein FMN transferase [Castellaniella sp. GW247-6E4]|uniref:FAD:protein FMN transferase n=1 Tax=Castellaniella sp. GW247-6E4 TaxID=3140380 RepID=UPI003315E991
MSPSPVRRRFIGILAACSALGAVPWAARRAAAMPAAPEPETWRGIALGADAELRIYHPDRRFARDLIQRSIAEVHRLEQVFSLYREDSVLARLNRDGRLDEAPSDMLRILELSAHIGALSGGAFDPSVQPLWTLYAEGLSRNPAWTPDARVLAQTLERVDYTAIHLEGRTVRLGRPGMALTLNGIAQGYITDRVTELLRDAGLDRALVDMGEIRGLDRTGVAPPWRAGLADPEAPGSPLRTVELRNQALATSSGVGTLLDRSGRYTHLFDPHTGEARPRHRSVSVLAPEAATADALSTAFSVMSEPAIHGVLRRTPRTRAWALPNGAGEWRELA